MKLRRFSETLTTNGSGVASQLVGGISDPELITGFLYAICYAKDDSNPYDTGFEFIVNLNNDLSSNSYRVSGTPDYGFSTIYFPRAIAHNQSGVEIDIVGTTPYRRLFPLINNPLNISVSDGGASNVGTFHIIILDHFDFAGSTLT